VLSRFIGRIRGLKYYRDVKQQGSFYFADDARVVTESDLVLYYRFNRAGFFSNVSPLAFSNYGVSGSSRLSYRDSNFKNVTFRTSLFISTEVLARIKDGSERGNLDEALTFDGVTCMDSSEKIYFPNANSYARSQI
jgi:hypothetical protein